MPPRKIVTYPDPVLSRTSRPVDIVGDGERALLDDMTETMYLNQGVGLAAPQVGVSKRAIVVDVGDGPVQLFNPAVFSRSGSESMKEGCLSLPETMVDVKRPARIKYRGLDRAGRPVEGEAEGLLARAIQHEIDHLDGRLILAYANLIKRAFMKRRLIKKGSGKKISR
jgi:peptide deformylase